MSETLKITGGEVLSPDGFVASALALSNGVVAEDVGTSGRTRTLDATGLHVLPGIIDIHGDAFERQLMPRPAVMIDPVVALLETDRQLVANGITTAHHGVTWSWEPGLRGPESARRMLTTLEALRPTLAADTRYHLRQEVYNLSAESEILDWIGARRIDCLAFNDHMTGTIKVRHRPDKMRKMIERTGLADDDFQALVDDLYARSDEVPASIERMAAGANAAGVPTLSHDDMTPDMRAWFRSLGCRIAEFPVDEPTTVAAARAGDPIVFGAPNVLRGGSHTGCPSAGEMVARDMCTVLASDYYYPALPLAPFKLARERGVDLAKAWGLVSTGPADALGLTDRGRLSAGLRADVVLVDARGERPPCVVATIVAGRIVHLADASRLA